MGADGNKIRPGLGIIILLQTEGVAVMKIWTIFAGHIKTQRATYRQLPHQLRQRLFVLAVVLRIDVHGLDIDSTLFLSLEPVDTSLD